MWMLVLPSDRGMVACGAAQHRGFLRWGSLSDATIWKKMKLQPTRMQTTNCGISSQSAGRDRHSSNYLAVVCQWFSPSRVLRTLTPPFLLGVDKVQLLSGGGRGESKNEACMCISSSAEMQTLKSVHDGEVNGKPVSLCGHLCGKLLVVLTVWLRGDWVFWDDLKKSNSV